MSIATDLRSLFNRPFSPWITPRKWWVVFIASCIGLIDSFWIMLLEIEGIKNPLIYQTCTAGDLFNCGIVVRSWQAQAFGFPNPLLGILFYELFLVIMIVARYGFTPSPILKNFLSCILIAGWVFSLWLFMQSWMVIGVFCIYCLISTLACSIICIVLLTSFWNQKKLL